MNELNRRRFLKHSLAGAGTLITTSSWASEKTSSGKRSITDRVELGHTGIRVSRLAQGTGMRGGNQQSDHTRLGQEKFTQLVRHGFDLGINFFDSADLYGSHPFYKNALAGIPRDQYVLLSKLWFRPSKWGTPSGGAKEEVNRFRKELGTEMIDVVLIHCVTQPDWINKLERVRDDLSALKEKGVIRACGVSCHGHEALKVAAQHEWADVIFARINHAGKKMDGKPDEIAQTIRTARTNGKAVVGMKIFGEGTLTQPEQKDASLQYVWKNDLINAMTIGMMSPSEVDDSIQRANQALNV